LRFSPLASGTPSGDFAVPRILPSGTYHGTCKRSRRFHDLVVSENEFTPGFVIPQHAHAFPFFGLVIEGEYRETYGSRSRECSPSTLLFHPLGEVHSEKHYDCVVRVLGIEPSQALLGRVGEYARLFDQPQEYRAGPLPRLGARLYREFQNEDPLAALVVEGIALELLAGACHQSEKPSAAAPPRWLHRARVILDDRFHETLTLEEVAQAVGVHPAHLARSFRSYYRCTVGDYVRSLRVQRGREELSTTNRPITEIALMLGYADQSHFATSFKRQTGMTPGAFRKAFAR
jgi:AraC family transcriptional regulator